MSIGPGTRVGPYEVIALLGEGGMGKVWRARHVALRRDDALKVLPDVFAADAERVARFEREAQVLASLNHPHIAQVHGLEEVDGTKALVMELVEGPTLADRLALGPVPLDEALAIARQVADALEAAHEQGIVHRDLKPANIKLRPDGTVKVLDFGLAKSIAPAVAVAGLSDSPTLTSPAMTQAGIILGTAAYMSPEQARGKPVDRRTDIWAFGVVLLEMLTGRRVFPGDDVVEVLGRVVTAEPDWSALPSSTPPAIRRLLRRALEKHPGQRLGDIRDAWLEIEEAQETTDESVGPAPQPRSLLWAVLVLAGLTLAMAVPTVRHLREPAPVAPREMRVEIGTPLTQAPYHFAWSPDGRFLVFIAVDEGRSVLWLREMQTTEARPLAGTDEARMPFWSPDGRSIAYFASGKLFRIDVSGGLPQELAVAPAGRGGAWSADGTILFAPTTTSPLFRIADRGGSPTAVTRLDPPRQTGHRHPEFLPGGRQFLFSVTGAPATAGVYLGALDGTEPTRLTAADSAAKFLPPDRVVFVRQGALVMQRLTTTSGELLGDVMTIADSVGFETVTLVGGFAVAPEGAVAYRAPSSQRRQLIWFDRGGKRLGVAGEPDTSTLHPDISPDGKRLAITRVTETLQDVWLLDLTRGGLARFTFLPGSEYPAVWSRDGTTIAFNSNHQGPYNLYGKSAGGVGREELLFDSPPVKVPQSWSKDDRFLLYYEVSEGGRDLWALNLTEKGRAPLAVATSPYSESNGQFSPDGRWVAYQTDESGGFEIVVQAFPEPTTRWTVSIGGGTQPRWSADGRELYYIASSGTLMTVPIADSGTTLEPGAPSPLFETRAVIAPGQGASQYAVARDGRILINTSLEVETRPITIVLNWTPPVD